uniref:Rab-GAP TBC domain-containing protein n=1 Tax=Pyxicephalus adspersus TaxID=30357 RepID=A0AAV2ZJ59_PYXAD|nr:TPA: hypothetical protein GDO54_004476 [Pyxicephalus adspersus]
MVGPEDGGSPVFQRCGKDLTEEGEEEEEAGDSKDILQLYITGMRLTNGDVGGYLSPGGSELRLPNGGVSERPPCACHRQCCSSDSHPPESSPPASAPPPPGSSSSSDSSPLSAHTVAGYFVSAEADRFRFLDVSRSSRNTFEVSRRQSAPDHLDDGLSLAEGGAQEQDGERPWRMGIADFFSRNFFSKRSKDLKSPGLSAPGWKLFGKVPPRENIQKDSKIIQQDESSGSLSSVSTPNLLNAGEYETRTGRACKLPTQSTRRKKFDIEPLSTTALILEDRPANLPAKSVHETLRHRQEYDEMVAEAKKRARRNTRRVRDLWWQGLPPSVRGKVWSLAIGNELNITPELYEIFLSRAKERWKCFSETGSENETEDAGVSVADREASLELIKLDISRTFPSLYIFQKGGPYHDLLHSVLGAYTCYRPDVGYVQGMSFIAAVLILNLEEADAFIAFANLLNKPCQLAFFRVDHSMMLKYFAAFEVFFEENLPKLFLHFNSYGLTPDIYLIDWIFTLYSKSLPLDLACRVWDVFCRDGEEFLFRTALGILRLYEDILLQMDFIHIAQFLTKLPDDITSEKLFTCIAAIQMQNSNKKWTQVFASLMKDYKEGEKNSPASKT